MFQSYFHSTTFFFQTFFFIFILFQTPAEDLDPRRQQLESEGLSEELIQLYIKNWQYIGDKEITSRTAPRRHQITRRLRLGDVGSQVSDFFVNLMGKIRSAFKLNIQLAFVLRDKIDPTRIKVFYPSCNTPCD